MKNILLLCFFASLIISCKTKKETVIVPSNPDPLLVKVDGGPSEVSELFYINSILNKLTFLNNGKVTGSVIYNYEASAGKVTVSQLDSNGKEDVSDRAIYYYEGHKLISQGKSTEAYFAKFDYDGSGHIIKLSVFEDGKQIREQTYEYDSKGNLIHEIHNIVDNGTSTKNFELTFEYDSMKNPMKNIFPTPSPSQFQLLSTNNVTKTVATSTPTNTTEITNMSYTYNSNGYPETSTITKTGEPTVLYKYFYE